MYVSLDLKKKKKFLVLSAIVKTSTSKEQNMKWESQKINFKYLQILI